MAFGAANVLGTNPPITTLKLMVGNIKFTFLLRLLTYGAVFGLWAHKMSNSPPETLK